MVRNRDRAPSVDATIWDGDEEDAGKDESYSLQPDTSPLESESYDERRVQSPVFQALRCTDADESTFLGTDKSDVKEVGTALQIDERKDSADHDHDHPAVIDSLQRPSSPHERAYNSTSIDTTMWMHRGNGRCLTADDSLTTLIDISDNKNRNADYDIYEDYTKPMSMSETTYFNKKTHKRNERIDGNERESRSKRPIDTERQHTLSGRPEWQDFMGTFSGGGGGSAARARPQFPASISIPVPTPTPTPAPKTMLKSKFHSHSQSHSQMKSDKGLSKSQSQSQSQSQSAKQLRQCLTIEKSKSVQTFEAKQQQSNANKSISSTSPVNVNVNVNRSVSDLRNGSHVTKLRRKSQQAQDISNNNFYSHSQSPLGKNLHKDAMQGDFHFNPSAIQLGFLF